MLMVVIPVLVVVLCLGALMLMVVILVLVVVLRLGTLMLMVVIPVLMVMLLTVVVVMLALLHTFNHLLLLDILAKRLKEINHLHIFIGRFLQRIFNPAVRLAADIDEEIAVCNFHDIFRSRLIAVKIHAVIQQHRQLRMLRIGAKNLLHPIILRIDRRNNTEFSALLSLCRSFSRSGRCRTLCTASAARKRRHSQHRCRHNSRNIFLHNSLLLITLLKAFLFLTPVLLAL